jgi:hypothetical protein
MKSRERKVKLSEIKFVDFLYRLTPEDNFTIKVIVDDCEFMLTTNSLDIDDILCDDILDRDIIQFEMVDDYIVLTLESII